MRAPLTQQSVEIYKMLWTSIALQNVCLATSFVPVLEQGLVIGVAFVASFHNYSSKQKVLHGQVCLEGIYCKLQTCL